MQREPACHCCAGIVTTFAACIACLQSRRKFTLYQPIILYRKFSADHIFNGYRFMPAGTVLITDETGCVVELTDLASAGDDVQYYKGILTPGFINAHCHLELSHMKGMIPRSAGLVGFVQQVMTQRTADMTTKEQAMIAAAEEMYESGIVAVGDICNTPDSITVKQNSRIHWHNFIEVSGFVDAAAQKRYAGAGEVLALFNTALPALPSVLSPHAPYSVSRTLFELLNEATAGKLVTIHNQESAEEDQLYLHKAGGFLDLYKNFGIDTSSFQPTGKSSLQSWLPYFKRQQHILLVHDTFTGEDDLHFLQSHDKFSIVLCPNANLYIENRLPDIENLIQSNVNIAVGTDSYASNDQLQLIPELLAVQQQFPQLPVATLLQWITSNGAAALQVSDKLGSFEVGKIPGIVLVENSTGLQLTKESASKRIL